MAEQPTYKILPEDKCLSESQLFDYIDGKLKTSDMHFIEKHILSCGFCSDALDGLEKVKRREKVVAFIPSPALKEEKEEPKVIPLNPNRKYYALAAGIVLILGITLFLKLSTSADLSKELATISRKDSMSLIPNEEKEKPAPPAVTEEQLNESDTRAANDIVTQDAAKGTAGPGYLDVAPPVADENYFVPEKSADELSAADKSITSGEADGDMDDYPNVVDAKLADVEQREESSVAKKEKLSKPQPKQATAEDGTSGKYARNKESESKNDQQRVAEKDNSTKEVPVSLSTTAPTVQSNSNTAPASTNSNGYVFTSPTTGSVTVMDSVTVYTKTPSDTELDLSYENANKMLAAGQAAASLSLYDEVLKNPAHKNYQDAQWKKAEALITLKRIDEAKKLLNEIVAKNGKYKAQAKEKLKTL